MSPESPAETRFITDRMLGTLSRYLRFMGYNTVSANGFAEGNAKEDTLLLNLAIQGEPHPAHAGHRACTAGKGTGSSGEIR